MHVPDNPEGSILWATRLRRKYLFFFFPFFLKQKEEELGQPRKEICSQRRTKQFIKATLDDQQESHVADLQPNIYFVPLIYRHIGIKWTVSIPWNSFIFQCASCTFAKSHRFPASWIAAAPNDKCFLNEEDMISLDFSLSSSLPNNKHID